MALLALCCLGAALFGLSSASGLGRGEETGQAPLYGMIRPPANVPPERRSPQLARLDPATLRPLAGRRLTVSGHGLPVRSPDGRSLLFVDYESPRLRVVDLARMRSRASFRLPIGVGWRVREAAWLTADHVVVLTQKNRGAYHQIVGERMLLVVDPFTGHVLARRPFADVRALRETHTSAGRLVLVLGGWRGHSGRVGLAVVDGAGQVRSTDVVLGPISGRNLPTFSIDPTGERALLLAAGSPLAEIDLATLDVTRHDVTGGGPVFGSASFSSRGVVWLDATTAAVSGVNVLDNHGFETTTPVGVALLDTTTWQARLIDRTASQTAASNGIVLAYGAQEAAVGGHQQRIGLGLRAYDAGGRLLWTRYPKKTVSLSTVRDRLLAQIVPPRPPWTFPLPGELLDLHSGKRLGAAPRVAVLPEAPAAQRRTAAMPAAQPALQVSGDGTSFHADVRDDVTRIVAVRVDGTEQPLAPEGGAVQYDTASPDDAVRELRAYVADQLVSDVTLAASCGGLLGPCTAAVATQSSMPEYAFLAELPPGATTLTRIDPRTLLPVGKRLVIRPGFGYSYGRSPNGRYLAIADRDAPWLRIIDLRTMRMVRHLNLGGPAGSSARIVAWLDDDRLAALTQRLSEPTHRYVRNRAITYADPLAGRVFGRHPITDKLALHGWGVSAGRLVVMLRSSEGKGSTVTLVVADAGGRVREAEIEVGRRGGALQFVGFALEPSAERAFLLRPALKQDTPPVIAVDLDTMAATEHQLRVLDPERERATAFGLGPFPSAFGEHQLLAMSTVAASSRVDSDIYPAAGVFAIDTQEWTAKRIDDRATYFKTRGDRLVTYGRSASPADARKRPGGTGVTVYDAAGAEIAHLYGASAFSNVELAGHYGHVLTAPSRTKRLAFDAQNGKALGMLPRLRRYVVVLDPPPAPSRHSSAVPSAPSPSGHDPAAFDRAARPSDALPTWFHHHGHPPGTVTESRLLARYVDGRHRVYRLFVYHVRSVDGLQTCTALIVLTGFGGGCSPSPLFQAGRSLVSGSGGVLYGIAAPGVGAVKAQALHGHRTMRLTSDGGFIHDCHRHDGCHCIISALSAYDTNGTEIDRIELPSMGCTRRGRTAAAGRAARAPGAYSFSHVGRRIRTRRSHRSFFFHRRAIVFLVASRSGSSFYRISPAGSGFTCFGNGSATRPGEVGVLDCPDRVGDRPLIEFNGGVAIAPSTGRVAGPSTADGFAADGVATIEARDADDNVLATVSPKNNVYAFPTPLPKGVTKLVALDDAGRVLPNRAGRTQHAPPYLFGPRIGRVKPTFLRSPVTRVVARGVIVTLGRNGVVLFDATHAEPLVSRRALAAKSKNVTYACFRVTNPTRADSTGLLHQYLPQLAVHVRGLGAALDGCEIQGGQGHRWRDQYGTHALVEAAFTPAGRRFFADRAAARDLTLFLRSSLTQRTRHLTGDALRAALTRAYGRRIVALRSPAASPPVGQLGYWADGARTIFVERSETGTRFFVELSNGQIRRHNLGSLGGAF